MRKEIPYEQPYERQKVYDPTSGKKDLTVPDCSHLHGFAQFQYPPVADTRDLPGTAANNNKSRNKMNGGY